MQMMPPQPAFIQSLREWLVFLKEHDPVFGYFVEQSKSCVIMDVNSVPEAENIFREHGVKVLCSHAKTAGWCHWTRCWKTELYWGAGKRLEE